MDHERGSLLEKFKRKVRHVTGESDQLTLGRDTAVEFQKETVLIVDDEKHALDSLELQLEDKYRVLTAGNGFEALEILKNHPEIGLAVIDMRMPKMDGLELSRRMEKIRPVEKIIRSAQIGRYGEAFLLNEIGPYVMLDKSPQGTKILTVKIEEAFRNLRLATTLIG